MTKQKNDQLKQNRIQWRRPKTHHRKGDYSIIEVEKGLRRLFAPGKQSLSRGEIEAIFRWEDDGGRTH